MKLTVRDISSGEKKYSQSPENRSQARKGRSARTRILLLVMVSGYLLYMCLAQEGLKTRLFGPVSHALCFGIFKSNNKPYKPCPLGPPTINGEVVRFVLQTKHTVRLLIYFLSLRSLPHLLAVVLLQVGTWGHGTKPPTQGEWVWDLQCYGTHKPITYLQIAALQENIHIFGRENLSKTQSVFKALNQCASEKAILLKEE